jgi:uncharacterized membrane protein (DUF373 family)
MPWQSDEDSKLSKLFNKCSRVTISFVTAATILVIFAASIYTIYDIRLIYTIGLYKAFKSLIVDMLILLALIEILRTVFAYLKYGRVRISYVIEAVIVTVLSEGLSFWYSSMDWKDVVTFISFVFSLICIRIFTIKYSPINAKE